MIVHGSCSAVAIEEKSRDLLTIKRAAAIQEWRRMAYAELLKFFYVVYKFRDATS
jgi:hypothetical protein